MSKNLQNMMASKYPTKPRFSEAESPSVEKQSFFSGTITLDPKKILLIVAIISVLFFILSNPYTFKKVGSLFPKLNSDSSVDSKLLLLHTLVFAVLSSLALKMV